MIRNNENFEATQNFQPWGINQIPTKNNIIDILKKDKNILFVKRFPDDLNHKLFQQLHNNEFRIF